MKGKIEIFALLTLMKQASIWLSFEPITLNHI